MPQIEIRDLVVHYEQFGHGPDLVWVAGGGGHGSDWHPYQIPWFEGRYRNTTFDNRGIGRTRPRDPSSPTSWSIAEMADDLAELIETVCEPPVQCVGLSMGSLITQTLAISRPDLVRSCVVMGTIARSTGWVHDYMSAEIAWRKTGGSLSGMMSATHYAAFSYPVSALSDPGALQNAMRYLHSDHWTEGNEESLVPQWQACDEYDVTGDLPGCHVPMHVIAFDQDLQMPPAWGREVADLAGNATFTMIADAGHYSCWGHRHDEINRTIDAILSAESGVPVADA